MKKNVICIIGPTATGKTDLACHLYDKFTEKNCELISVDSALVYKHMDIGTAKPDNKTLKNYPHHLINIINPEQVYSVGDFYRDTHKLIAKILAKNKTPILVGGTMMYYNALFKGLSSLPSKDDNIRKKIEDIAKNDGWEKLYKDLIKIDPKAAKNIHVNDSQRITRALEVFELTGKPISYFWEKDLKNNNNQDLNFILICLDLDRDLLHKRIEARFDKMLDLGFLEEVKLLMQRPGLTADNPSMKSVGYRQAWIYLESLNKINNNISFDEMREKSIIATRRLAKHQFTWLKNGLKNGLKGGLDNIPNLNIVSEIFQADQNHDKLLSTVIKFLLKEKVVGLNG